MFIESKNIPVLLIKLSQVFKVKLVKLNVKCNKLK